jgi:hypothetical protein
VQIILVWACEVQKEHAIVDGSVEHSAKKFAAAAKDPGLSQVGRKSFQPCVDRSKKFGIYFEAQLKTQRKASKSQATSKLSKANQ